MRASEIRHTEGKVYFCSENSAGLPNAGFYAYFLTLPFGTGSGHVWRGGFSTSREATADMIDFVSKINKGEK